MILEFGKNLKKLRREKDLTQDELAVALSLSPQAISRYETGMAYPDIEMLPVIAGFFGVTIDKLLGVSSEARECRMEEYTNALRKITDRKERLALLRKQHAEFPDAWDIISDMVYEMTYIPECLDEMREIVNDSMKNCNNILWRENMIFFYLESEPDEGTANAFIEKWCSRYNMTKVHLLEHRYNCRGEYDKRNIVKQKILRDELCTSLLCLTERTHDIKESTNNCRLILNFLCKLSENPDLRKPDMWINTKLICLLRLANNSFMLSDFEEGFAVLEDAVSLFENFFALESNTLLTYGTSLLDRLCAVTYKEVHYNVTEFTGMIAHSMMMNLKYQTPIGPIDTAGKTVYDMEGFEREMVFSSHTYNNVLRNASWDGFARVKDDTRYIELRQRAKKVSSLENLDNMMYLINSHKNRTDDWVKGKKWCCALLVKDTGAYIVWDDPTDIEEKFNRIKNEGNTSVCQVVTAEIGGDLIDTPEVIKQRITELNADNRTTEVVLRNANGELYFQQIKTD